MLIQQGDVLIERCDAIPGDAVALDHRTLAEGEATGHYHEAQAGATLLEVSPSERYLHVDRKTTVTHQEHHTVTVPPGDYRVRRVREYDHFLEEAREVAD